MDVELGWPGGDHFEEFDKYIFFNSGVGTPEGRWWSDFAKLADVVGRWLNFLIS